jgi:hypothetical protein
MQPLAALRLFLSLQAKSKTKFRLAQISEQMRKMKGKSISFTDSWAWEPRVGAQLIHSVGGGRQRCKLKVNFNFFKDFFSLFFS